MGGIGQNILREIKEDGGYDKSKTPTIKELLEQVTKKEKKRRVKQKKVILLFII